MWCAINKHPISSNEPPSEFIFRYDMNVKCLLPAYVWLFSPPEVVLFVDIVDPSGCGWSLPRGKHCCRSWGLPAGFSNLSVSWFSQMWTGYWYTVISCLHPLDTPESLNHVYHQCINMGILQPWERYFLSYVYIKRNWN